MAKANAYSLFVKEVANRRRSQGQDVNFGNLFKELDEEWRSLPDSEKEKYKKRSKQPDLGRFPRYQDSQSNSHSSDSSLMASNKQSNTLKRPHEDSMEIATSEPQQKKLRPGIPNARNIRGPLPQHVKYMDFPLIEIRDRCELIMKAREKTLLTTPFYAVSTNVLCKHKNRESETETDIYVPLEVAIHAYTIKDGTRGETFHALIVAGDVPSGSMTKAIDHATKHKITFPPHNGYGYPPRARVDYKEIYKEMLKYTKEGERILLVNDKLEIPQVRGCLEWLHNQATRDGTKLPKVSVWQIIPAVEFFGAMYNHCLTMLPGTSGSASGIHYFIKMKLEGSFLDYNSAIMCDYHKQEEYSTNWCAQSCAIRMFRNLEGPVFDNIAKLYKRATEAVTRNCIAPATKPLAIEHQSTSSATPRLPPALIQ